MDHNLWWPRQQQSKLIEIRQTLRYLGVPIKSKSYMFGDNKSVVTSATIPHSLLSKRHNILSYHRVREPIAAPSIGVILPRTKVISSVSTGTILPRTRMISSVSTGTTPKFTITCKNFSTTKEK